MKNLVLLQLLTLIETEHTCRLIANEKQQGWHHVMWTEGKFSGGNQQAEEERQKEKIP